MAGVSKATFYNAFRDENFLSWLEEELRVVRNVNDFAVMHNLAEQAKTSKNHNMIALFQRLQNRLKEGGEKPAQIHLHFHPSIQRPKFEDARVIDVEPEDGTTN